LRVGEDRPEDQHLLLAAGLRHQRHRPRGGYQPGAQGLLERRAADRLRAKVEADHVLVGGRRHRPEHRVVHLAARGGHTASHGVPLPNLEPVHPRRPGRLRETLLLARGHDRNPLPGPHGPVPGQVVRIVPELLGRDLFAPLVEPRQTFKFHILEITERPSDRRGPALGQMSEKTGPVRAGLILGQPGGQQGQHEADCDRQNGFQSPHPARWRPFEPGTPVQQHGTGENDRDQRERGQPHRQNGPGGHDPLPVACVDVHAQHSDELTGLRVGQRDQGRNPGTPFIR
jgi:hypothetical protein